MGSNYVQNRKGTGLMNYYPRGTNEVSSKLILKEQERWELSFWVLVFVPNFEKNSDAVVVFSS